MNLPTSSCRRVVLLAATAFVLPVALVAADGDRSDRSDRSGDAHTIKSQVLLVEMNEDAQPAVLTAGGDRRFGVAEARTVEVHVDNGEVHVRVNGEDIPAGKVVHEDGRIIILDDNGNEVRTIDFDNVGFGDHRLRFQFGGEEDGMWISDVVPGFTVEDPTVMMGIILGTPGPALERHLHLEHGTTTMITAIYEGLPADDAGLDEFDILIEINGKTPADPAALHEALVDKGPGDVLRFKIIHEGREQNARVTLEAYDREAMAEAKMIGSGGPMRFETKFFGPGNSFFGDVKDFTFDKNVQVFVDDDHRIFELLPDSFRIHRGGQRPGDRSVEEVEIDSRLSRIHERLGALQEMLIELLEEADKDR